MGAVRVILQVLSNEWICPMQWFGEVAVESLGGAVRKKGEKKERSSRQWSGKNDETMNLKPLVSRSFGGCS
jgi:hypothetical protein